MENVFYQTHKDLLYFYRIIDVTTKKHPICKNYVIKFYRNGTFFYVLSPTWVNRWFKEEVKINSWLCTKNAQKNLISY